MVTEAVTERQSLRRRSKLTPELNRPSAAERARVAPARNSMTRLEVDALEPLVVQIPSCSSNLEFQRASLTSRNEIA